MYNATSPLQVPYRGADEVQMVRKVKKIYAEIWLAYRGQLWQWGEHGVCADDPTLSI